MLKYIFRTYNIECTFSVVYQYSVYPTHATIYNKRACMRKYSFHFFLKMLKMSVFTLFWIKVDVVLLYLNISILPKYIMYRFRHHHCSFAILYGPYKMCLPLKKHVYLFINLYRPRTIFYITLRFDFIVFRS